VRSRRGVARRACLRRALSGGLLAAGLAACGREGAPAGGAAAGAGTANTVATAATAATAAPCTLSERWEPCFVEKRLENSGLVPVLLDSAVTLPMFSRPARHYRLGRGELYVVLYPDSAARAADLATVDSLTVTRRGTPRHAWSDPPFLVVSRNAAAVLLTSSDHLVARIEDLFTAGLPTLQRR
jgi:hypothetical protein